MSEVVIIGAGIAGLSCAWTLRTLGIDSVVVEGSDRPGGVIRSHRIHGYLVESGPNSILPTEDSLGLIENANLIHELVEARPRSPRFIYTNGALKKAPFGALSASGLLRLFKEPLIRSKSSGDESVADFFTRRLGREAHDRLIAPLMAGIYAGNTARLSASAILPRFVELERQFGSLAIGMLRSKKKRSRRRWRSASFVGGMETLPKRLAESLNVRLGLKEARLGEAPVTVVTAPAYRAVGIVEKENPNLARLLENVEYAPIVIAASSVPANAFARPLRGFGFLVPRSEGLHVLGTLFSSALFPGRAPRGRALLTTFLGGVFEPDAVDWPDDRVWDVVTSELQRALGISTKPEPVAVFRHRKAIPQYNIGHDRWLASLRDETSCTPGLFLAANYVDGVSVTACMEQGQKTAHAVAEYLRRKR